VQRIVRIVSDFLQIILVAGLLTSGHIIVNKRPPELRPGVNGAFPHVEKSLVCGLVDDHRQIVGHHIFNAMCCSDNNFIKRYPLFGISLPIICVKIVELEVSWPDDSTEPISEWSKAGDMASTRCIATTRCTMCSSYSRLRCISDAQR
jgi:hypothetical protein